MRPAILNMDKSLTTVDHARKLTLRLIEIKRGVSQNYIEAGKIFKEIRDNRFWELEGAESFNSYIAEIGYDRTSAFKMIQVFENFIEGKSVESIQQLSDVGWAKLSKVAPHVDENNYKYMLELVEGNSLSDIDKELVRQHYITKKEGETEFVECPYCHKSFVPVKRQDKSFPQIGYTRIIETYKKVKEIELQGKEYEPIQQSIKTMFLNGRTPDEIIGAIEWLGDNAEYEWTIHTLKNKIAEILPKFTVKKQTMSEEDKRLLKGVGING